MCAGILRSPSPDAPWEPSYLALVWGRRPTTPQLVERMRAGMIEWRPDLRPALEREGLVVFTDPADSAMAVYENAGRDLIVIGCLFDQDGEPVETVDLEGGPPEPAVERLFGRYWGDYATIALEGQGASTSIARDPGGGLDVHVIDAGGVAVVTDAMPRWLAAAIDRPTPIDKAMLANALAMPLITTHKSLLRNVVLVPAGGVLGWHAGFGDLRLAWSPASSWREGAFSADAMRETVFASARAWSGLHDRILIELSGGLDSAIVLGALARSPGLDRLAAINLATCYSGGDERELARAAAEKWGIELVELTVRESEFDYRPTLTGPQPLQPNLYGLDPLLEAGVAGAAEAFGSKAILTGQGGDAIFFQMPTEKVAIDYMRAVGLRALFSAVALDAARRTRRSVWSVQWQMIRDRLAGTRPDHMPIGWELLGKEARALIDVQLVDHPWLLDAAHLPPAKQAQILAIANGQLFNGPCRRRAAANLRHPLLSQPVVEAWLAAPSYVLSAGTQDRAFARALFADLLPPSIARRRGKGETSIYYRRALVENLDFLRGHLLDGTLVANDLLDPDRLDALMDEQAMLVSEEARSIASLASLESWARYWGL